MLHLQLWFFWFDLIKSQTFIPFIILYKQYIVLKKQQINFKDEMIGTLKCKCVVTVCCC